MPALACAQYAEGRLLRDQVRLQAGKYDDVVIDAGGHDSTSLRAALLLAGLIEEARGVRDGLLAMGLLNIADPGVSSDNADAEAALADLPQLIGLQASITRRRGHWCARCRQW
jgi:chromosome partitioning protein